MTPMPGERKSTGSLHAGIVSWTTIQAVFEAFDGIERRLCRHGHEYLGKNRIGVGVSAQGGEQAMAVGYQRAIGNRASVSPGAAFGGGEKSVSAGAGFSW